jgi:hypothetical protein
MLLCGEQLKLPMAVKDGEVVLYAKQGSPVR